MKIYFAAAPEYKQEKIKTYQQIVEFLHRAGHEVFEKVLSEHLPVAAQTSSREIAAWHQEWSAYISECDLVIIEGSYPSTIHIGFELGLILSRGKPVVLLFERGKDPVLIDQIYSSRLVKSEYADNNLSDVLAWCLEEADKITSRRFTFFIPPDIEDFLDKIVAGKETSRSEYIRKLIKKEMKAKT